MHKLVKSGVQYSNRVVVFLDILGFREFVAKSNTNSSLASSLHEAITNHTGDVLKYIIEIAGEEHRPIITNFSDCIVMSSIADRFGFATILYAAAEVCIRLQYAGLLCRGGIDVGKFYHDDKAAFGPALVKAYHLENDVAKFPQVVLSKEANKLLDKSCSTKRYRGWFEEYIEKDESTSLMRLNPHALFDEANVNERNLLGFTAEEFCRKAKSDIILGLMENSDNPRIIEKYDWAAKQLNKFIRSSAPKVKEITNKDIFTNFSPTLSA